MMRPALGTPYERLFHQRHWMREVERFDAGLLRHVETPEDRERVRLAKETLERRGWIRKHDYV